MKKIATLGPKGTFSELAAINYMEKLEEKLEIVFYPSITKAFNAVDSQCEFCIIPIENTLDGYVQVTLDLLAATDLDIIGEVVVPVQFAFVGNINKLSDIKRLFVQFKTEGQCMSFIESLDGQTKKIITESNSESFEKVKEGVFGDGAIIPLHILEKNKDGYFILENVTDSRENETRFITLSKNIIVKQQEKDCYKTSLVVTHVSNKSGALAKILNEFANRYINLTSIISRPTKAVLGEYLFFIDIDGHCSDDEDLIDAIKEISKENKVNILESFKKIKSK